MDDSLFGRLELLELMAFFSGYPLVYALAYLVAGKREGRKKWQAGLVMLLPYAYALTGTLFLGLQLRNWYPDYAMGRVWEDLQYPFLKGWAFLSLLFWIPAFSKMTVFSLLHSLVFLYLIARDLFVYFSTATADRLMIRNDMKVYTDSILLNLGTLATLTLLCLVIQRYRRTNQSKRP